MKYILFLLFFIIPILSEAQNNDGFDPEEAKDLIAICNSYTFIELYGSDSGIIPSAYSKLYTSDVIGLDNKFQVYKKGNIGVLNFRGSTSKLSSWVENFYSAMIPAEGNMNIDYENFHYKFAQDSLAAVHSGYALAIVLLSPFLIEQVNELIDMGVSTILITGHSQGGALAQLCQAYFENIDKTKLTGSVKFKTYSFANPMCGNKLLAQEFNTHYCDSNKLYAIINPADLVPKMPIHYQEDEDLFSLATLRKVLNGEEKVDIKQMSINYAIRKFEGSLTSYVNYSNQLIEKLINNSYSTIVMPDYTKDINYYPTGILKNLAPFIYPEILIDTTGFAKADIEKLGLPIEGKYYKKEPSFFQHKPYNYYVGILKTYFPKEFDKLEIICLPENL